MSVEIAKRKRIFPLDIEFPNNLPSEDGVPMETPWHWRAMVQLVDSLEWHWRDRDDFFVGGNMFLYFSRRQLRNEDYRGPDFFAVKNVERGRKRRYWAVWDEDGRYPDVIVELLSPSTADEDRTTKRDLYEKTFHTGNYVCCDPDSGQLFGWRLANSHYEEFVPNERGWLWCDQLDLWIGHWRGRVGGIDADWPRFYTRDGKLVPTAAEAETARAEAETARAEAEAARAEAEAARAEGAAMRAKAQTTRAEAEAARAEAAETELKRLRDEVELLRRNASQPKPA